MITCSLDWSDRREEIQRKINVVPQNRELKKMLHTIDNLVRDLSRAEVDARRLNKEIEKLPELAKVNNAIETLEQWLIMGALLKNI